MTRERHTLSAPRVPTIMCDPSSWESFKFFNPNDWTGRSKDVISSTGSQYGLILYQNKILKELNLKSDVICLERYRNFEVQWNQAKWNLDKGMYLVEIPAVHLHIQSIYSIIKTYLDLIAQLIATEGIVSCIVDGFHKDGKVIGGRFLNILNNNSNDDKKKQALKFYDLVIAHKKKWIDEVVKYRDIFTHPVKGLRTVMFELILHEKDGQLILLHIKKPEIEGKIFDVYIKDLVDKIDEFTKKFLYLAKNA